MDVVRAVFAAFAERDIEGVLRFAAPEIEFSSVTSDYAGRTTPYRGHEGIRASTSAA
jgi:ketosteroid isomerase-like protein